MAVGQVLADPNAVAARVDGRLVDLTYRLEHDAKAEAVTFDSEEGRQIYWHSASHLMAQAIKQLYPGAKVTIGPAVAEGFYYDFDVDKPFTEATLRRLSSG